jgi:hypothetical protein
MNQITVADLIQALAKLPPDAEIRAYEGEARGFVVEKGGLEIAFIHDQTDERPVSG